MEKKGLKMILSRNWLMEMTNCAITENIQLFIAKNGYVCYTLKVESIA
jgi:hypothetical protein